MADERILVVDDVGFNRLLLEKHLTGAGYTVCQAPGGPEAIRLLSRERFDLVITDLMMPKMDGLRLFDERRKLKVTDDAGEVPCPPFILCTAHIGTDLTEEAVRKGFVDVLTKPVDQARLLESVNQALVGAQEALTITLIGNPATVTKKLAEAAGCKPDPLVATIVEVVSLLDLGNKASGPEALKTFLAEKLGVDLGALIPEPVEIQEKAEE